MNLRNLRWPAMVAAMAITLAGLFGTGILIKNRMQDEPLRTLYSRSPGVESYLIEHESDRYKIKVLLKETSDLATTYQSLDQETARILKDAPYTLKVEDRRSPELTQAFHRVNLYVQEALVTGQFAAVADRAESEAAKAGLTLHLDVDNARVYVDMHGKGGAYLYSVVDRPQPKVSQTEGGIGL